MACRRLCYVKRIKLDMCALTEDLIMYILKWLVRGGHALKFWNGCWGWVGTFCVACKFFPRIFFAFFPFIFKLFTENMMERSTVGEYYVSIILDYS